MKKNHLYRNFVGKEIPHHIQFQVTLTTSQISSFSQISAIGTLDIRTLNTNWYVPPVEWVDNWPDFIKVKKMRDKYPALDKAMEKAISIYNMVKDDYDNPVPKK